MLERGRKGCKCGDLTRIRMQDDPPSNAQTSELHGVRALAKWDALGCMHGGFRGVVGDDEGRDMNSHG